MAKTYEDKLGQQRCQECGGLAPQRELVAAKVGSSGGTVEGPQWEVWFTPRKEGRTPQTTAQTFGPDAEANARVIAAAPDLLKAAELVHYGVCAYFCDWDKDGELIRHSGYCDLLRGAIERATQTPPRSL